MAARAVRILIAPENRAAVDIVSQVMALSGMNRGANTALRRRACCSRQTARFPLIRFEALL